MMFIQSKYGYPSQLEDNFYGRKLPAVRASAPANLINVIQCANRSPQSHHPFASIRSTDRSCRSHFAIPG